ncbi:hypothetical protein B0H14DRAFT_3041185 [Mycena olivaceomarginata]|nr:hypothetical protein B0H14DRAFT_3041185 [Mycena olivaceomarginata]
MEESLSSFIALALAFATSESIVYNSRRLETIGYAISVIMLRDLTTPDRYARGVYVDHALVLPRASLKDHRSSSLADFLEGAYRNTRDWNFWRKISIDDIEVPVLEERKRSPTRHPTDLEDHVKSIITLLNLARKQVVTQCTLLFLSPRFWRQDTVILLATAGPYYRLAVVHSSIIPHLPPLKTKKLYDLAVQQEQEKESFNVLHQDSLATAAELLNPGLSKKEKEEAFLKIAREEAEKKTKRQMAERAGRAKARREREARLSAQKGLQRKLSKYVLDAGEPAADGDKPYSQTAIEEFWAITVEMVEEEDGKFFEEIPGDDAMDIATLARRSMELNEPAWTGVICVGSDVSARYKKIIHDYLSTLANSVREDRKARGVPGNNYSTGVDIGWIHKFIRLSRGIGTKYECEGPDGRESG